MRKKILTDDLKKQVIENYVEGKLLAEIKQRFSVSYATIDNIVNAAGIPRDRRQQTKKYDYNMVCELYRQGKTTREVAIEIGGSRSRIGNIVKEAGISRERFIRDSIFHNKTRRCTEFDGEFRDYLDGLIISDGFLGKPHPHSIATYYAQSCVQREWLEEIQSRFLKVGIESSISIEKRRNGRIHVLRTLTYDQLYFQYNRWYKDGEKIVPRDIEFTVPFVKNWVYGDGTCGLSSLRLCCDSFSVEDIDFLIEFFGKHGFLFKPVNMGLSKAGKVKWRISLNKTNGLLRFFEWLGSPIKCFGYKWKVQCSKPVAVCGQCGNEFVMKAHNKKWCSRKCCNRANFSRRQIKQ